MEGMKTWGIAGRCFSYYREKKSILFIILTSLLLMLIYETTFLQNNSTIIPKRIEKETRNVGESNSSTADYFDDLSFSELFINKTADLLTVTSKQLETYLERQMEIIVEKQRLHIEEFLSHYNIPPAANVSSFRQLLLSEGGKPIRNMVVTTWRSGSTFLGDLMQSHTPSFYHYEPLLPYGITRIRGGPLADLALKDVRKLINCDYHDMDHYIQFGKKNGHLFSHNEPLWKFCKHSRDICSKPKFLSNFCSLFPFQNIKTVRLLVNLTEELLEDSSTNILLLIRDPRGIVQSRHHRVWCPDSLDCHDPQKLCQDLVDDYHSSKKLAQKYPKSFKVIRYEDLSLDIYNKSHELFDFFRLKFHSKVNQFLHTHTKESKGDVSSTFRNSKIAPLHWRTDMSWSEVASIQDICAEAIKLWGYKLSFDEKHVKNFNPIGKFTFPN